MFFIDIFIIKIKIKNASKWTLNYNFQQKIILGGTKIRDFILEAMSNKKHIWVCKKGDEHPQ